MHECAVASRGFRFFVEKEGREVGHAYLYVLQNDLHQTPFGLLEDVFVDEQYRGQGVASELLSAVFEKARLERCYKLLATSRNDGTRASIHSWYERLGLKAYGTEFRIDL
jgi:GNAT superfamily N-acetyltransferase